MKMRGRFPKDKWKGQYQNKDFTSTTCKNTREMVVVSSLQTNLDFSSSSSLFFKPISPSLLYFQRFCRFPCTRNSKAASNSSNGRAVLVVKAYMDETTNPVSSFVNKVVGSLPVVGLIARIVNEEGGIGGDIIDFAEFRRRVGNKCSITDSRAFYEFRDRRGKTGDPLYVLLCCWLAAVGAGLLKSEEILEGVARLSLANDIEFEEQNFIALMNEAREKRAKLGAPTPKIPMEIRAEKALEAVYVCCFGRDPIEEEDEKLLSTMLSAVFPTVGQQKIESIVKEKAKRVADGTEEIKYTEPKQLSKEAVQLQMKDLEFLKQNSPNQ